MAVQYCNYDIKGTLAVAGSSTFDNVTLTDLYVDQYIYHNGDTDTFIRFLNNRIIQQAGSGNSKIDFHDNGQLYLYSGGSSTLVLDTNQNATFEGAVTVKSGNKLILNRPNNGVASEISTDAAGAMILNSVNDEGFKFQNAGTTFLTLDTSDNATFAGDVTVSGGDITLGGTGRIQGVDTVSASTDAANKAYVDAHVSPAGTYLPLAGGTMSGNIVMGDNDITGIDQLTFSSGTYLTDVSSNYVQLRYASADAGGIIVLDGDGTTQGYLYADGGATSNFGLLHGSGSWAVRCKELAEVELRYNNTGRLRTINDGVYVAGLLGIGTSDPDAYGYSYAEDLVIYGGSSADDGAGITIRGNGKRYGIIAFGDTADANAGEIFYDHDVNAMYF